MSKMNIKRHAFLALALTVASCGVDNQLALDTSSKNSFKITSQNENTGKEAILPPDSTNDIQYSPLQTMEQEKPFVDYDNTDLGTKQVLPADYHKYGIQPGIIEVVLKDNYGIKIQGNKVVGLKLASLTNPVASQALDAFLRQEKVTEIFDAAGSMKDSEVIADRERIRNHFSGDIPSRYSIQTYTFPEETDLISVVKKLREMPFVRAANLVYQHDTSIVTKTQLGVTINNNASTAGNGFPPSDPGFAAGSEENDWWWFQRHKVFKAWELWDQVGAPKPTIAVIDSGFDTAAPSSWDPPIYLAGKRFNDCSSATSCAINDSNVSEPTHPHFDSSHGTSVAGVLASPRNNSNRYSGIAPGANIYPIRVMQNTFVEGGLTRERVIYSPNIAAAIRHAASLSNVDVISMSLANGSNSCPSSQASLLIRNEISSAISAGKIVVAAAGNKGSNLQSQPISVPGFTDPNPCRSANNPEYSTNTGGEIIVGAVSSDTAFTIKRTKGWNSGVGYASNYDSTKSTASSIVDIAAAGDNVLVPMFDPNTGNRYESREQGTSIATPMVAATAGMMKKIAQHSASGVPSLTLSPSQVENLLVGAADISRYTGGTSTSDEVKFLGENMDYQTGNKAGVRSLNVYNALLLARFTKLHPVIVRLHNVQGTSQFTHNNDWSASSLKQLGTGYDAFWAVSGLTTGNTLNFRTSNTAGTYTTGYNVFRYNNFWGQSFTGVSGIAGTSAGSGYFGTFSHAF